MMSVMNMNYFVTGTPPARAGNAHQNIVPYQVFACADGHLILAVGNDGQFAKFCDVAGAAGVGARSALREERRPRPAIARCSCRWSRTPSRTRTQRDWLAALEAAGVPCGPINRLDAVFADPQVVARGMRIDLPHPLAGTRAAGRARR